MDPPKRFLIFMLGMLILDSIFAESKKMEIAKRKSSHISKEISRKAVNFATSVALKGVRKLLKRLNPFVGLVASFFIGNLIDAIWPSNAHDPVQAPVLEDIRKEMNHQSIERMKMKLRDYGRQIKHLFSMLHISEQEMKEWKDSVASKGLSVDNQHQQLKDLKNKIGDKNFEYFKTKLIALTTDIGNDRHDFYIPNDPITSLAYYREFATIQINLLACEIVLLAGDNAQPDLITSLRNKLKSVTASHYKFVLFAAHKSAAKIEDKTRKWEKYDEEVDMVVNQYPLEEWKKFAGLDDDSKYIRNNNIVALHSVSWKDSLKSEYYGWMSCFKDRKCKLRKCQGVDNPLEAGDQNKCKRGLFVITGDKGNMYGSEYIRTCDKVALVQKGFWLIRDSSIISTYYTTRKCPGKISGDKCGNKVFTLTVEGKECGNKLEDRDVVKLKDNEGGYVGDYGTLKPSKAYNQWRIFKSNSFVENYFKK